MQISELARRAGVAASAVRWYEAVGVLPAPPRRANGYRDYSEEDVSRLRIVISLRRLGLGPEDAGRLARLCLKRGGVDRDLAPLMVEQRDAISRQRGDLDRLDAELTDLELTIDAAGRARAARKATTLTTVPIRVLFVCTGNSARSQMAEALLAQYGRSEFEVQSAGTIPRGLHPLTVRVLAEMGIDWSTARSKSVDEFEGQVFDYIITVCDRARQACPAFPGSGNSLHWGFDDPAEVDGTETEKLDAFRRTRMELTMRLRPFIEIARRTADRTLASSDSGRVRAPHRGVAGPVDS